MSDQAKALGQLLAGAINQLLRDTYHATTNPACCPERGCCGQCWALRWYRDNERDVADEAAEAIWDGSAKDRYDWQTETGGIDWDQVSKPWERADELNCHKAAQ